MTLEVRSTSSDCCPAPTAIFSIEEATSSVEAFTSSAVGCSSLALSATDCAVRWMRETRSRRFSCIVRMALGEVVDLVVERGLLLRDDRLREVAAG